MLSKQFISFFTIPSISDCVKAVLISCIFISGCTSTSDVEPLNNGEVSQQPEKIANEEHSDNDLLVRGDNSGSLKSNSGKSTVSKVINLYLQQQSNNPITVPEYVLEDYHQAIILMKAKKWSQAETLFDQVITAEPNLSGSYINKAIIAKQQGNLLAAQGLVSKAIEINKLNLYAHHLQGKIYRLQGQFDKAEQSYLAALAIWPNFPDAQASMAILLELYRGRLLDAHTYYQAYLVLKPEDEEVKRWLAGLEIKIKRAGLIIPSSDKVTHEQVNGHKKASNDLSEKNDG